MAIILLFLVLRFVFLWFATACEIQLTAHTRENGERAPASVCFCRIVPFVVGFSHGHRGHSTTCVPSILSFSTDNSSIYDCLRFVFDTVGPTIRNVERESEFDKIAVMRLRCWRAWHCCLQSTRMVCVQFNGSHKRCTHIDIDNDRNTKWVIGRRCVTHNNKNK